MGDHHHPRLQHEAVESLVNLFSKANHDLSVVQHKLDREFRQIYPDNANPMMLVSRIKRIQADLSLLKEECRQLLTAKQDLIDKTRTTVVGNRSLLQRLQTASGVPVTSDSDDLAYSNFNQIIYDWTVQVGSRTENERHETGSEDINQLLFSAIVRGL